VPFGASALEREMEMNGFVSRLSLFAVFAGSWTPALAQQLRFRPLDLPSFTAIQIATGIEAEITVGGEQTVRARARSLDDMARLKAEVVNGKLTVWIASGPGGLVFKDEDRPIQLIVTAPALHTVAADSRARVTVVGVSADRVTLSAASGAELTASGASGETFQLEASSGSTLNADGTCVSASAGASSGAHLLAGELLCTSIDVQASSDADVEVYASSSVEANASSNAHVNVLGLPQIVNQRTASGGSVTVGAGGGTMVVR
jgi:hypothetical protein